jgi:hypothetical protein
MPLQLFLSSASKAIGASRTVRVVARNVTTGTDVAPKPAPRGRTFALSALLLSSAIVAWPTTCVAQSNIVGSEVEPNGPLPMRDAPPEGLLGEKGSDVGQAIPNHTYLIVGQKSIHTIFNQQTWLYVQDTMSKQRGWVYSGSDKQPFQNVTLHAR